MERGRRVSERGQRVSRGVGDLRDDKRADRCLSHRRRYLDAPGPGKRIFVSASRKTSLRRLIRERSKETERNRAGLELRA